MLDKCGHNFNHTSPYTPPIFLFIVQRKWADGSVGQDVKYICVGLAQRQITKQLCVSASEKTFGPLDPYRWHAGWGTVAKSFSQILSLSVYSLSLSPGQQAVPAKYWSVWMGTGAAGGLSHCQASVSFGLMRGLWDWISFKCKCLISLLVQQEKEERARLKCKKREEKLKEKKNSCRIEISDNNDVTVSETLFSFGTHQKWSGGTVAQTDTSVCLQLSSGNCVWCGCECQKYL